MSKLKYIPEISLGHIIQIVLVAIPAIAFWIRLEARVSLLENQGIEFKEVVKDFSKTMILSSQNQAILSALFDRHVRDQEKQDERQKAINQGTK